MKRILSALLAFQLLSLSAWALASPGSSIGDGGQFETATVVGVAKDASGAVVPSAMS